MRTRASWSLNTDNGLLQVAHDNIPIGTIDGITCIHGEYILSVKGWFLPIHNKRYSRYITQYMGSMKQYTNIQNNKQKNQNIIPQHTKQNNKQTPLTLTNNESNSGYKSNSNSYTNYPDGTPPAEPSAPWNSFEQGDLETVPFENPPSEDLKNWREAEYGHDEVPQEISGMEHGPNYEHTRGNIDLQWV